MELELKAEPGCAWVDGEIHLWHLAQARSDTALCELRLDCAPATWPSARWADVFPERLCSGCRRRYAELLPVGEGRLPVDPVGTGPR